MLLKKQIADLQRKLGSPNEMTLESGQHAEYSPRTPLQQSVSSSPLPGLLRPLVATNDHPILFRQSRSLTLPGFVLSKFGLLDYDLPGDGSDDLDRNLEQDDSSSNTSSYQLAGQGIPDPISPGALPSMEETRGIIRSLLESAKHGPSNLDKIIGQAQLEEDCRLVYGPDGLTSPEYAGSRFRCFITVYLAMCMAAAANGEDVTEDTRAMACRAIGMQELVLVTSREDLVSRPAPKLRPDHLPNRG